MYSSFWAVSTGELGVSDASVIVISGVQKAMSQSWKDDIPTHFRDGITLKKLLTKPGERAQTHAIETVNRTRKGEPAPEKQALKFKLVIAYDGTRYQGWQIQKIGTGVQQIVEEALRKLFPGVTRIHGSSRTDTGVHALGMVAHVEIPRAEFKMTPSKLAIAINAFLPEDVRVLSAARAPQNFHARFDASGKQYRYFVWNLSAMNPLLRAQAWHVPVALDLSAMRIAAKLFVGKHDFKSFAGTRNYEMDSNVRTVTRCQVKRSGPLLTFTIEGDGFLYKMCRGIVGTLVQIGQGKFTVDQVKAMLAARDRREAGMTAPARGLVLWKVFYRRKK